MKDKCHDYKLHAILIHKGGTETGHYYCYIKTQTEGDQWICYNDEQAYTINRDYMFQLAMGSNIYDFRVKENHLLQKKKNDNSNAYILMYIRTDSLEEIINPLDFDECPRILRNYFDEEEQKEKMLDEINSIKKGDNLYIISEQMIKDWHSFGIFPNLDNLQEELPLLMNPSFRCKISVKKKIKFGDLKSSLLEKSGNSEIKDILFFRVVFVQKAGTHDFPKFVLKPVSNMEEEIFEGNSRKIPKKSVIYIRPLTESLNEIPQNLFTKISEEQREQYHKVIKELEDTAVNVSSGPLDYEVQTYFVTPSCPLIDRLSNPEEDQTEETKEVDKQ